MQNKFLETLNIYRGKAALKISLSPELGLIFIDLAAAIPGMENKLPAANQKKYQWEKKLTVSFNFEGALEVTAMAEALIQGREGQITDAEHKIPTWYRDPSKTGRKGNPKTFGFFKSKSKPADSRNLYYIGIIENNRDGQGAKIGVSLEYTDLYKIASVMKEGALALLGWRTDIEVGTRTISQSRGDKEPMTRSAGTDNRDIRRGA